MKRKNLLLVAAGILCLILTSCSSPGDADKTDKTVKTETFRSYYDSDGTYTG